MANKHVVCDHPATLNHYGFPGHMKPWSVFQDFNVNFGKAHLARPSKAVNREQHAGVPHTSARPTNS